MRRYIAPLTAGLASIGVFILAFTATAHASQAVAPDDGSLLDLARPIFDQVMAGHYIAATALALVFCVALAKRYAPGRVGDFIHSDPGGALATLLMAFGGALATATMGGAPWTWGMLWAALTVAFAAAGGYALIKKLIVEPIRNSAWYRNRAPMWAKAALQVVFWMFDKKAVETDATKAGQDAVDAKPSTGVDGVLGNPTEIK